MRDFINDRFRKIKQHQHYDKAFHWAKLISVTGGAQILVQAMAMIAGLIIIRLLPTREYAFYTIANTMLGTMTLLSDSGISTGVMANGGKVWQDKFKLGKVLATGIKMRREFAIYSLLVSMPILAYLLWKQDAGYLEIFLIILSLIPAFLAALNDSLLETIPKLHQSLIPLQKNQVAVSIGRVILSSGLAFIFPLTFVAMFANGIPRIIGNMKLKKIVGQYCDLNALPDEEIRKDITSIVKKILPGAIYYCLSGQLNIWILSFFGNSGSIASIGALSRISMLLTLFSALMSIMIVPRFARLKAEKTLLVSRYLGIILFTIVILTVLSVGVDFFSEEILMVLGNSYKNLNYELVLSIIGGSLSLLTGFTFSLYSSRGWVFPPYTMILINIVCIAAIVSVVKVDTLLGVLYFNIILNLIIFIVQFIYGLYKVATVDDKKNIVT